MKRRITTVIVHCSDSNFGNIEMIRQWHKMRGFKDVGYHFVIYNGYLTDSEKYIAEMDGLIVDGRPLEQVGAHCMGYNSTSIGICLIGKLKFSYKQLNILLYLLYNLLQTYPALSIKRIYGHRDLDKKKTCPNFDINAVKSLLFSFEDFNKHDKG